MTEPGGTSARNRPASDVVVLLAAPLDAAAATRVVRAAGDAAHLHVLLPLEDVGRRLTEEGTPPGRSSWASALYLAEGGVRRLAARSEEASAAALRASLGALVAAGAASVSGGVFDADPVDVLVAEVIDRGSDAVIIVARPGRAAAALRVDAGARARRRLTVPVTRVDQ